MKKALFVIGGILLTGSLYAACVGPFCWDDTGASVEGFRIDGNGQVQTVLSSTTIAGLANVKIGQEVVCNTCVNAGTNSYGVCIATSTVQPAFVLVSSTTIGCK